MIYYQRQQLAVMNPPGRDLVENPPWLAREVTRNFDRIQAAVPAKWWPAIEPKKATGRGNKIVAEITQYGCGAYGCVMPTADAGVVFKITQDSTEVEFIREVIPRVHPPGITAYHGVIDLDSKSKKRPSWALWRESAEDVGKPSPHGAKLLNATHKLADEAYGLLHDAGPDADELYEAALRGNAKLGSEPGKLSRLLDKFVAGCLKMADDAEMKYVGQALLEYLRNGYFIADVHSGNVGTVTRGGQKLVVITDPGHCAVLPEPWPMPDDLRVNPSRC